MGKRILVVDDEVKISDMIKVILEAEGFEVTTCHSGAECLEEIRHCECDLILLDILLPDMDGWEVLEALKDACPDRRIPLLMISAKADSEEKAKAESAEGVDGYIVKPFSPDELLEKVVGFLA